MTRAIVRSTFILIFTAIAVLSTASDLALPWHPYGSFGFLMSPRATVIAALPGTATTRLHPGETIDVARMTPEARFKLGRVVKPGTTILVPLSSGRTLTFTATSYPRTLLDNVTNFLEVLAMLAYILIAASLVLLRPMPSTWAFYVFSYPFCTFAATPNTWPFPIALAGGVWLAFASTISPVAFVSFALRFPEVQPAAIARRIERILIFVAAPLLAALSVGGFLAFIFAGSGEPPWTYSLLDLTRDAFFVSGVLALLVRFVLARSDERNRLRWVVAAFAVAYLPFISLTSAWNQGIVPAYPATINLSQMLEVLAPIALAYTVLKHRLFDIRIVVSRALVYAVLMSVVVGVLALADWGFGRWLAESRFAFVIELALALALGAMLTMLHRRVELLLNQVIFRAQTAALQALRRFAQEADLVADPQRLLAVSYETLRARLQVEYVAIYTADGAAFALGTPGSDATPAILPGDDLAVLRLRRWNEAFECDEPAHKLRAALMVPMTARAQLIGFIVCGPKVDRTHYLPEEVETLVMLAHRVGTSYGWLTMRPYHSDARSNVTSIEW